jgi:hypothetical protein
VVVPHQANAEAVPPSWGREIPLKLWPSNASARASPMPLAATRPHISRIPSSDRTVPQRQNGLESRCGIITVRVSAVSTEMCDAPPDDLSKLQQSVHDVAGRPKMRSSSGLISLLISHHAAP